MADPEIVSDDDAPEEITLNKGREEAEESRRNEKENSKRLAAELKEKRKARSEKQKEAGSEKRKKKEAQLEKEKAKEKEAPSEKVRGKWEPKQEQRKRVAAAITDKYPNNENGVPEKSRSQKRKRDASNSKGEGELAGKVVRSNMLDDSVVQLIRAREKQVGKGASVSKHIDKPKAEPKAKKPKPTPSKWPVKDGRKNSRIQIVSLQGKPNPSAINKALNFRNKRFFGSKAVQRSKTMLPTTPFVASV